MCVQSPAPVNCITWKPYTWLRCGWSRLKQPEWRGSALPDRFLTGQPIPSVMILFQKTKRLVRTCIGTGNAWLLTVSLSGPNSVQSSKEDSSDKPVIVMSQKSISHIMIIVTEHPSTAIVNLSIIAQFCTCMLLYSHLFGSMLMGCFHTGVKNM